MSETMTAQPTVLLEFPLRGEWVALHTPADRVPTHGTNFFGQRYAYDFVRPTGRWWAPFGPPALAHAWFGVPVEHFRAWNAPVHAAHAGRVVAAADGWPDRRWAHALWDLARLTVGQRLRPLRLRTDDWRPLAGNHVLVEGAAGVSMYGHLRQHSIAVRVGDIIAAGDPLGAVGHSGRSTMPHLHFQLMDGADALHAAGLRCGFTSFERWNGAAWVSGQGVPGLRERIRVSPASS